MIIPCPKSRTTRLGGERQGLIDSFGECPLPSGLGSREAKPAFQRCIGSRMRYMEASRSDDRSREATQLE